MKKSQLLGDISMQISGHLTKMTASLAGEINSNGAYEVSYLLQLGDDSILLKAFLGKPIQLSFSGAIFCSHCGRRTKKSFNQGYCFPCFQSLAQCDRCIVSPELCHFDQGTCREPAWGEGFCMNEHVVYLANSSGLKVGITRVSQVPTRWIDQGAVAAIVFARVATRFQSGLLESILKQHVADKTNWRAMLKGSQPVVDLELSRAQLAEKIAPDFVALQDKFGIQALQLAAEKTIEIDYPVLEHPSKVVSINAEKEPDVNGVLLGIKGQYLIFDTGVINLRKYTGYEATFCAEETLV